MKQPARVTRRGEEEGKGTDEGQKSSKSEKKSLKNKQKTSDNEIKRQDLCPKFRGPVLLSGLDTFTPTYYLCH